MKKPVEVRRAEILDTAVAVVRERGFGATRVQDVAGRLGVSTGLIHYHFDSKDQLLAEAFAHAARKDTARFPYVLDAPNALAALARTLILYMPTADDDAWAMWIDAWSEALRNDTLRAISQELDHAWGELVEQVIDRGVASGEFTSTNGRAAAWRIAAVLDGLAVEIVVHRSLLDPDEMLARVADHIAAELKIHAAELIAHIKIAPAPEL